jgi:hypothetical protein
MGIGCERVSKWEISRLVDDAAIFAGFSSAASMDEMATLT